MVTLKRSLEALLGDVLTSFDCDFNVQVLKRFWWKPLKELTEEEVAYTLTAMVFLGSNLSKWEKARLYDDFFKKNLIVALLREDC